jgi:hypothetical protein
MQVGEIQNLCNDENDVIILIFNQVSSNDPGRLFINKNCGRIKIVAQETFVMEYYLDNQVSQLLFDAEHYSEFIIHVVDCTINEGKF